ncbi:ion transporting ATPase [Catenulispora acidiphila DSM 44928]|uniref:Ion transporting ATPase n=1 Tax=Catenulispora acidiphila (strain DSM 44928 / JCM 14897 / NBRC 102108 / NRRL B-24433 / ID139908) TaxID=479433 RepID=C7QGP2_CATAD|nr:ArsA-related P-loop ATPase [Catenulispora acidiphila]ACU74922.1 ion transporting ATPase [Catenulispora acidiphila DSM 44928]
MTRLLFLTGPGGAGTTTLAAATALSAASRGHRVLLLGVSDAGELAAVLGASGVSGDGNVLDIDDGLDEFDDDSADDGSTGDEAEAATEEAEARRAALANLTVRRFDPAAATETALVDLAKLLSGPLAVAGLSAPDATELGPVPGLPDILALREIATAVASAEWDTVVVDGPPLKAALAMLAWPETAAAALRRVRPIEGQAARALRPLLAGLVGLPAPFTMVTQWTDNAAAEIAAVRAALVHPGSVVRIVGSPSAAAQPLLQATPTLLALQGLRVDAETLADVPRADAEPLGVAGLQAFGAAVYGEADPGPGLADPPEPVMVAEGEDGGYRYEVPLPGVERDQLGLVRSGDELVVSVEVPGVAAQRRAFPLPAALRRCRIASARISEGVLRVGFQPDESLWPERFLTDHSEDTQNGDR